MYTHEHGHGHGHGLQPVTHIGLQRGGGVHLLLLALVLARTLLAVAGPAAAPELDRMVIRARGEQMAQRVPRQRPDGRLVRLTRDVHAMGMCVAWECACHDGCTAHAWAIRGVMPTCQPWLPTAVSSGSECCDDQK
eukprot:scaffold86886_cov39-Phaeocystis_antarctica.AAC.1